jgi:hypothetical protein
VALFRATAVRGIPSLQRFPLSGDRPPLSGRPGFLAVIHPRAVMHDALPFAAGFADARAHAQWPGSPDDYGLPFGAPEHTSRLPWVWRRGVVTFRELHPLRSSRPSWESVRDRFELPLADRPILSWVSAPLEPSPPSPRSLDPPGYESRTRAARRETCSPRLEGPQPLAPGEVAPHHE